ncbi:MAG: tyrosine-type recombinase/integrase [Bryobacterales bacterium]|nr:tyrosine-type recombinase/integrase [Bryobacterales bacterium]
MTLREAVEEYVAHRRATGVLFDSGAAVLGTFCRSIGPETPCAEVPDASVRAFLDGRGTPTRYWERKRSVLAGFYAYATARGLASRVPLPSETPRLAPPLVPYVYSREEIRSLLSAADSYRPRNSSVPSEALRTLILLLYATGLRVGEALALRLRDVDLPEAVLTVRRAKFHKTRLVPMGADLVRELQAYRSARCAAFPPEDHDAAFLADSRGGPLRHKNVGNAFRKVREAAGVLRTDGARYQPRIHDLRGTFATQRLTEWYRRGEDVQRLLPLLSTYLGHASVAETEPYLATTPALLGEVGQKFERHACAREGGCDA